MLGEVFISRPGYQGCHWALLYIDLTTKRYYYCDTFCCEVTKKRENIIAPFVEAIHREMDTKPKPLTGMVEAHFRTLGSNHLSSEAVLKLLTQTYSNVCGVVVVVVGAIAYTALEI